MPRTCLLIPGWTLCLVSLTTAAEPKPRPVTPQEGDFFEKKVRPVLADNCWSCHGPKKQMSGLRLDTWAGIRQGGDNGPVVKPGAADESPLIQAVRHEGNFKMPPKKQLSPDAVAALTAWVKMGAPWPTTAVGTSEDSAWKKHWAFQPVRSSAAPAIKDGSWPRTAIDHFILAKLEGKDLQPSRPADRRTLLRRVTFDLIGLPPTPEEIDAALADPSPGWLTQEVERLLASPHYGERWGRHWLDVARYADTKGYVFLDEPNYPWAYTYRDYVVRAFNADLPYDRFILEQLAADRLDLGADRRPLTAMGFLTVGGRFMNNSHDILDDRIDTVTRGLMGLTVSCARCHDHKFDPIPTKDYYSLYGVFASCVEPTVPPLFEPPPQTPEYEAFEKELRIREQKLTDFMQGKYRELVAGARHRAAEYLLAAQAQRGKPTTENFMLLADTKDLNPTMILRWKLYLDRTAKSPHSVLGPWHAFAALPAGEFAAKAAALTAGYAAGASPVNSLLARALAAKPPATLADAAQVYGQLFQEVDKLWQEAEKAGATRLTDVAQEELRQVLYGPDSPPSVAFTGLTALELLPDRPSQNQRRELLQAVEKWRSSGPGAPPRAMVMEDRATLFEPRVFLRGSPNNRGEAVPRQFLAVLAGEQRQPFRDGSGRLELARAIADAKNPLTARVLVNRVWLHHFGQGLVRTPSDFGLRSEPPSHPALLDYLATEFVAGGWSIKKLHRLIVLSAAYQQQSDDRPDGRRVDPENTLLWKMNRRRLDLEATRDTLLAVSGRLDRRRGGPPMMDLTTPDARRRTLYGSIDRLNLPGLFRTFDFPSPDATSPQRDTTTVAPQALFLMNNPFLVECARKLVQRPEVAAQPDPERKINHLYQMLYSRPATAEEVKWGVTFVNESAGKATAWERYAQALLLANETVFVD